MNKPVKISLISFGVIIALFLLLIAYLLLFFDVNDYKGKIEKSVQEQTGRDLKINGKISLSIFPWLGLEVNDLSLGNAQGFDQPTMAQFEKVLFKVKLLPLLKKDIHIGTLQLNAFQIHLARNQQGVSNWQDLLQDGQKPSQEQEQASTRQTGPLDLAGLTIERIQLSRGELSWQDQTSQTRAELKEFNFVLGPVQLKEPIPFELSAILNSNQPQISRAEIQCSGTSSLDLNKQLVAFEKLMLKTTAQGAAIPGKKAEFSLSARATLDHLNQTLSLKDLQIHTYNLTLNGELSGSDILETPKWQGSLSLAEFNPKKLLQELQLPPLQTSDPKALSSLAASLRFSFAPKLITISDLQAKLDATTLQGTSRVMDFDKPQIEFALQADQINIDHYLAPPAKEGQSPPKDSKPVSKSDPKGQAAGLGLPLDTLRSLVLNGELEVGTLILKKMNLNQVAIQVSAKDGILRIDPLTAELYKGTLTNTTRVDVRTETPKIETRNSLSSIVIEPLLGDLLGKTFLSGTGGFEANLNFQGLSSKEILRSLGGNLNLLFEKGAVKGVNIPALIRSANALLKGRQPQEPQDQSTDFSSFKASADLNQGLIRKSALELISPLFSLKGQGQIDLVQKVLNYDLMVNIPEDISKKHAQLANLSGQSIPLSIKGDLNNPKYSLDLKSVLQNRLKKEGEKLMGQELNKLQEKLNRKKPESGQEEGSTVEPKKLLKGLFN